MPLLKPVAFVLGTGLALAGCGSSDVPAKQLADSEAAIRAASEVGAKDNPEAALHLKIAHEEYDKAQALSKQDKQDSAKALYEKAKVDAELALALTRKAEATKEADQAKRKIATP